MAFEFTDSENQQIESILQRYPNSMSATLPLLHLAQKRNGWISPEVVAAVAKRLDLSQIHVADVVAFYSMYHRKPVGKHVISICKTLCCQLVGQESLSDYLRQRLGLGDQSNGTDAAGMFTLQHVECLGACGDGPVAIIDGEYHEKLSVESLASLMDNLEATS
jgi:NADH-quinone oxidoreductase E subunit